MIQKRIGKLRAELEKYQVDAFLVTNPYNRRYITGFTGTAGIALITVEEALFITDFRYLEQASVQATGYKIIEHTGPIGMRLTELLQEKKLTRIGFEEHDLTFATYQEYKERFASCTLVPVPNVIADLRKIKDEQEMEHIRKAVQIVDQTYSHIVSMLKPGVTEIEVAHELEFQMKKLGASASAFDIIVASGVRSSLPHGVASEKVIEKGDFVTLDFGAVYRGYCSDITRTIAIGEPAPKLREIYDVCLQAQLSGVNGIRAGITGKEADSLCRDYIAEHGYGPNFGHSTGHGLGLEVHENPRLSVQVEEILQPGMVVTIEPGIYLTGIGGVRIEDDVLITEEGCEILTTSTKELTIID